MSAGVVCVDERIIKRNLMTCAWVPLTVILGLDPSSPPLPSQALSRLSVQDQSPSPPFSGSVPAHYDSLYKSYASQGARVIALASRALPEAETDPVATLKVRGIDNYFRLLTLYQRLSSLPLCRL